MNTPPFIRVTVAALALWLTPPGFSQDAPPDPIARLAEDPEAALDQTQRAKDAAIAAWPSIETGQLVDAVEAHAIAELIVPLPASAQGLMLETWSSHPAFVAALARVYTEANDGPTMATIAQAIATGQAEALTRYPDLAAAVCVVLDRPHEYPGLGAILPAAPEVFEALVFAHQDRRVMALPLDELPAEVLVYMTDLALTGEGIRTIIQERRQTDPLELYRRVPYRQAGLLAGEAALPPEEFTFDRIEERGGLGPLRGFYAEQLGQAFGYPVALATGHRGDERFTAPVFLERDRRGYHWNLEAIPEHPDLALGVTRQAVTGETIDLAKLVLTADLAEQGPAATRTAWALLRAARAAPESARLSMLSAAVDATGGFARAWQDLLALRLEEAAGEPDGPQRVLTEFFSRADQISPVLATRLAIRATESLDAEARRALLEWLSLTNRRNAHRYAAAQLALGDLELSRGDRPAAMKTYEDLVNRQADETPLALDALARLDSMLIQDGRRDELLNLYGRTHRRFRAPRTPAEAQVRASGFMVVGERYEGLLREAGREREADRLRRQLDRAIP